MIDDNQQITKMLTTFLHLKGHECISANDGKSGIEIIKNENFDAVMLYIEMNSYTFRCKKVVNILVICLLSSINNILIRLPSPHVI